MTIKRKLNLHNVERSIEGKKDTFELTINKGYESWVLDVRLEFDKIGINNVVDGLAKTYDKVGVILGDEIFTPYFYLLIIKEFTSLGEDISDDFEDQTEILKKLIQEDLLIPIIDGLPKEEVYKVIEHTNKVTELVNKNADKLQDKFSDIKLENKEIEDFVKEG